VRYIGVQAPFLSDGLIGAESADVNKKLVGSQVVTLVRDVSDADEDGRLLRYVLVGDIFVNFEMARTGYAKTVNTPPDQACLGLILAAENEARRTVVGVWAPTLTPTPTPRPTRTPTPIGGVPPTPEPLCNCRGKPLKCKNFFNHAEAQGCYDYCFALGLGDVFGLDKDGDGRVCEGLP
jgi:hypothetical protein